MVVGNLHVSNSQKVKCGFLICVEAAHLSIQPLTFSQSYGEAKSLPFRYPQWDLVLQKKKEKVWYK